MGQKNKKLEKHSERPLEGQKGEKMAKTIGNVSQEPDPSSSKQRSLVVENREQEIITTGPSRNSIATSSHINNGTKSIC